MRATARSAAALACLAMLAAVAAGCASTGAVPRPFPTPGGARAEPPPAGTPRVGTTPTPSALTAASIADTAFGLQGLPYRLGGSDPSGFDCSGLVQYVLGLHGIRAPRVVKDQLQLGRPVRDEVRPGDLVFFAVNSRRASHVGIAIDGDRFVHAPTMGQAVRVDSLRSEYWRKRFAGARRIELETNTAATTPPDAAPSPPDAVTFPR